MTIVDFDTHITGQEIPEDAIAAARVGTLPDGYSVERDTDGDWILCPPEDVTIFSVPGEGVLLGATTEDDAIAEAIAYLAA